MGSQSNVGGEVKKTRIPLTTRDAIPHIVPVRVSPCSTDKVEKHLKNSQRPTPFQGWKSAEVIAVSTLFTEQSG